MPFWICFCHHFNIFLWKPEHQRRRKWQPTPVFLPGESHGQRSLAGYSPWGHKESDTTEHAGKHTPLTLEVLIPSCWRWKRQHRIPEALPRAGLQGYRWVGKSGLLLLGDGFPVVRMTGEKRNKWRQLTLPSHGREQKPREPLSIMSKGLTGPQKSLSFFSKSEFENCRSRIAGPITQKIPDPGHPWSRWSFHRKS